jgi:hypothetical protein
MISDNFVKLKKMKFYLFGAVATLLLFSCNDSMPKEVLKVYEKLPDDIDFNYHVKPILSDKCFACHGPDKANQKAGLRLDTPEGAFALLGERQDHKAIVPGKLNKSHVYLRMISGDPEFKMPPANFHLKLTVKEIATISKWIEQGAEYKPHWAFISSNTSENVVSENSIDYFINNKLKTEDLKFEDQASKETLIRRASFDLTGLPPLLDDIDAFVSNTDPKAYDDLVDRLLNSKSYGERMASNWLDIARYADTDGYLDDKHREFSPYRDWVIAAFNKNMPYEQFVTWQLAGDLIPDANQESILATAFNRLNKRNGEAGIVFEEYRVEYTADRTNTIGKAFLGLSLECARCHDHKYDPISQKDYYKMFGFFNSTFEIGSPVFGPDQTPGPALLLSSKEEGAKRESLLTYIKNLENTHKTEFKEASGFQQWKNKSSISAETLQQRIARVNVAHYSLDTFDSIGEARYHSKEEKNREKPASFRQPVIQTGKKGNAFFVSDYNSAALGKKVGWYERTDSFSLQFWVYPETVYEDVNVIRHCEDLRLGLKGYTFKLKENKPSFVMSHSWPQNALEVTGINALPKKEWSQITITYNGSSKANGVSIYINGEKEEQVIDLDNLYKGILYESNIHTYGFDGITFGARDKFIPFKDGGIDEIKVFDELLTPLEVLFSYDNNKAMDAIDSSSSIREELLKEYYSAHVSENVRNIEKKLKGSREEENELVNEIPEIMVMGDLPKPRPTHVLKRGEYTNIGEEVEPGVPESIFKSKKDYPKNRLGLSQWLFDKENPLTARVFVNRIWQLHFGTGIVETSDDFGSQGSLPSHPELLDYLANYFIASGWDIKALHKKIMTSKTYMQYSGITKEKNQIDPKNKLLARGARFRLPAEMIRDNALAISGLLVDEIGGESVYPYQPDGLWDDLNNKKWTYKYLQKPGDGLYRRSLYTIWKRSFVPPSMLIFDMANRDVCTVKRETTNTPLQALVLLNDPQYVEAARVLAESLIVEKETDEEQVQAAFKLITGRKADDKEIELLNNFYSQEFENFKKNDQLAIQYLSTGEHRWNRSLDPYKIAALSVVANTIMNTDEAIMRK